MSICIYIECEFAMSSCTPVCLRLYTYNPVLSCLVLYGIEYMLRMLKISVDVYDLPTNRLHHTC